MATPEEDNALSVAVPSGEPVHAVVEPDGDLLDWLCTALSNRGISAACFADVTDAVAHVQTHGAKTLVLDIDSVQGERLEELRHIMEQAHVPVCAITGLPAESHEAGHFQAVLTKPFSIQEIMETIVQIGAEAPAARGAAGAASGADSRGDADQ